LKSRLTILAILLFYLPLSAQDLSNLRIKQVMITSDTLKPDSLMILPGSVFLFKQDREQIPDSLYHLDPEGRSIILDQVLHGTTLNLQYRVLSIDLSSPWFHKDPINVQQRMKEETDPFRITSKDLNSSTYYAYSELNKRGSISRGITFGNSQDVVVNSNLNLQLSGKLSDNLNIVAAISDDNVPIQPEGYSQQISEFDRVYIELFNEQMRMIAGDFELEGSPGNFLNFYKRAKGAMFRGNFSLGKNNNGNLTSTMSGAISKGKFTRNSFGGIEGNQGPYKLHGSNFEQFIVILAGSEKVFIDGRLLDRGLNNDYVVNYNSAEITFTPKQPITKDKRIIVEFEYSERSYARFLIYTSNEFSTRRGNFWINAYSEQDDKNQTLQQDLSDDDIYKLSQVGNDIHSAVVPRIDSVGYMPDEVLYLKKDTVVNGNSYGNVYVHSTNPDSAVYRLRFSFVGEGNGDYTPENSIANGKVFRWSAPVNGIKQGGYDPVTLLIAPGKKQVVSMGGVQQLSELTIARFELAMTNNDPNTFSGLDSDLNIGYAINVGIDQDFLKKDTSLMRLQGSADYRYASRYFNPVERFRSIEFSRDWNLVDVGVFNEHHAGIRLSFSEKKSGQIALHSEFLSRENDFEGIRNNLNGSFRLKGFVIDANGSLMKSNDRIQESQFARHRLSLAKHFPFMVVGIREEGEQNRRHEIISDSMALNSFAFQEFEIFLTRPDSVKNKAYITYKDRRDFLPVNNSLRYVTLGRDLNLGLSLMKNPNNRLNTTLTLRDLSLQDSSLLAQKPERTILGRLEHSLQLAGGAISTSTFYELGSGLETKKEYSYLEVPPGQGIYQWIDYNQNGIKELDEFEVARFSDEARFIRIFLPSGDYFTVYTNQFNQTIHMNPARIWKSETGYKKIASLFSDQLAYRISRKNSIRNIEAQINPFITDLDSPDLITFSSSLRNNLSFNKTGQVFGANYIYQKNLSKSLLVNGFDTRTLESHGFRGRINLANGISFTDELDNGVKKYQSEFLGRRNYSIDFITNKLTLQYQLNMIFRFETEYGYRNQHNKPDSQKSSEHNLGTELRYSILNKGVLTARMKYIHLDFNDDPGSPVAYEMLGSLLPGHNGTWTLLFQRTITGGIEFNVEYSGRISENRSVIHTGSMQVRANF
jgi:hypothetical protein